MHGYARLSNIWRNNEELPKTILPEEQVASKRDTDPHVRSYLLTQTFHSKCLNQFFTAVAFGLETKNLILAQVGLCLN